MVLCPAIAHTVQENEAYLKRKEVLEMNALGADAAEAADTGAVTATPTPAAEAEASDDAAKMFRCTNTSELFPVLTYETSV